MKNRSSSEFRKLKFADRYAAAAFYLSIATFIAAVSLTVAQIYLSI